MSKIVIKVVKTKKDLKKFIKFPMKLYKNNDNYVPDMIGDEISYFNRKKNASYQYCDSIEALAYKDNKIVGRICGLINNKYNDKINEKQLRFNHFDFIDDYDVSKALIDFVCDWGKSKGMITIDGPIGCTDLDKQGMLMYGYDKLSCSFTIYNYPYYVKHMEKLGFKKDVDWVEFRVFLDNEPTERIERAKEILCKRYGYKLVKYKSYKEAKEMIDKMFVIYNEAYYKLHGTVYLSDEQIKQYIDRYIKLINFNYLSFVTDKEDTLLGFAICVPSLSKSMQKSKGKLFPLGWYRLLKSLKKNDVLDMYLIGVNPDSQGYGLNSILINDIEKIAINNNIVYAETGPMLEDNFNVLSQWDNFNHELVRKRRCWIRNI